MWLHGACNYATQGQHMQHIAAEGLWIQRCTASMWLQRATNYAAGGLQMYHDAAQGLQLRRRVANIWLHRSCNFVAKGIEFIRDSLNIFITTHMILLELNNLSFLIHFEAQLGSVEISATIKLQSDAERMKQRVLTCLIWEHASPNAGPSGGSVATHEGALRVRFKIGVSIPQCETREAQPVS